MRKNKIGKQQNEFSILTVDDDVIMTETLQAYFQSSGFRVDTENDPERAVERVREGQYDIMLLDFLMSPICGDEVVSRIREFNDELYIILLTGHKSMAPPIKTIRELAIQGYYEKSDRFDQLELLVESCVKSIRQMRTIRRYQEGLSQVVASSAKVHQLKPAEEILDTILQEAKKIFPQGRFWIRLQHGSEPVLREAADGAAFPEELVAELGNELLCKKGWVLVPLLDEQRQRIGILAADLGLDLPSEGLQLFEIYGRQVTAALSNVLLHDALSDAYGTLRDSYLEVVQAIRAMVDAKDIYTRGHSDRVSHYAVLIAEAMGKDEAFLERIRLAGLFHDVGKIGTADQILQKDTRLTPTEYDVIKKHPARGAEILSAISRFKSIAPIVESHHERFDGRGYPNGLKGEEILDEARIISVADAFDAMTSDRKYHAGLNLKEAIAELERGRNTQFDGRVVDVFLDILKNYEAIQKDIIWTYPELPKEEA